MFSQVYQLIRINLFLKKSGSLNYLLLQYSILNFLIKWGFGIGKVRGYHLCLCLGLITNSPCSFKTSFGNQ